MIRTLLSFQHDDGKLSYLVRAVEVESRNDGQSVKSYGVTIIDQLGHRTHKQDSKEECLEVARSYMKVMLKSMYAVYVD